MAGTEGHSAELGAYDYSIRRCQRIAAAHWDMAIYFSESAKEQERLAEHYTGLRNEYLARLALDNVVVLPHAGEPPEVVA